VTIVSLDQLINGMIPYPRFFGKDAGTAEAVGIQHTPWYQTGPLGAGAAPTGALNGAVFTGTTNGAIAIPAAVSGEQSYITRISGIQTGNVQGLWVIDRLWGNVPVVTTTINQPIVSPAWPARDETASTNGAGVFLAMETSVVTGNAGAITNTTVSYTNSAGTAGRTATLASFPITGVAGTLVVFALQAGDVGVRSVQGVVLGTSYVSGAIHLVAFRLMAELPTPLANTPYALSWSELNMPEVWDNSVLQLVYAGVTGTALGAVSGSLSYAQG
jgi:hypothetical protein